MNYALITGASSGLGLEFARRLAADGKNVILVARSEEKLAAIASELEDVHRVQTSVWKADLSVEEERFRLYEELGRRSVFVDTLINNAGMGDAGDFTGSDWQKIRQMLRLNMEALTHLMRLFIPPMIRAGQGRIMNVASVAAFIPGPSIAVYHATKAYVLSLTNAVWAELKDSGVKITAFCPGPVTTDFFDGAGPESRKLTRFMPMNTPAKAAGVGYRAMKKGKRVAMDTFMNSLLVGLLKVIPVSWSVSVSRNMTK